MKLVHNLSEFFEKRRIKRQMWHYHFVWIPILFPDFIIWLQFIQRRMPPFGLEWEYSLSKDKEEDKDSEYYY